MRSVFTVNNLLPLRTNKCAARHSEVPDELSGSDGLGSSREISKKNLPLEPVFFNPPFHSLAEARASRRVRPRRDTSVGVWSRRPQLLRSFCSLHSGYSGRVKDSSFRARRAHDECRLSAEPLPIPPHGSIISQAPRRRSAPHRYPHRYPFTVSTTARSLPRLLSATATPALWWLQLNVRMVDNN